MTIRELLTAIDSIGLYADYDLNEETIAIYEDNGSMRNDDWFVRVPFDAFLFFHVDLDHDAASSIKDETMAEVEALLSIYFETPEEERGLAELQLIDYVERYIF